MSVENIMISGLDILWAKTPFAGSGGYLSLLAHSLDTAAVAWEILEREPYSTLDFYARDLGIGVEQAQSLVAALCGLHDLGKASPVFQIKWEEGAKKVKDAGFQFPRLYKTDIKSAHHQLVTFVTLGKILEDLAWQEGLAKGVAEALGSHHGFRPRLEKLQARVKGDGLWKEARRSLVKVLLELSKITGAPKATSLSGEGFTRLAGLASFSDWIASNEGLFPYNRPLRSMESFFKESLTLASQALDKIGWFSRKPLLPEVPSFSKVFDFTPRPLQKEIEDVVGNVSQPSLIIVEAPTGEGKTEAAFYAHLKLQEKLSHRGLYVGLPTQATGNQMFDRTKGFLERTAKRRVPVDLQLLHGSTLLKSEFQKIRVKLEEDTPDAPVVAGEWFTAKKRALLSEYGVGTIDQALLSVLNVKHNFVRMWGLGNRVVVFDEVHAYDTYTSGLLERLLSWLRSLGSSVILMSATLPQEKRKEFIKAYGGNINSLSQSYPRITFVSSKGEVKESGGFKVRSQAPVEICHLPLDLDIIAEKAIEEVWEGGCCLCVVNTVASAQNLYNLLKAKSGNTECLHLFHARYPARRRKELEEKVLTLFGKNGDRPSKAILVATQVVEQSLDLDFDVMFSELAPIDLLLQRAGRLHRHKRSRPANHKKPKFFVAGLAEELSALLEKLNSSGTGKVYEPYILLRSYGVLKEISQIHYPDAYDSLIEAVYGDSWDPKGELVSLLAQGREAFVKRENELQLIAEKLAIPEPERFLKATPSDFEQVEDEDPEIHCHLRALTRLGEPSLDVVVLHRHPNGGISLDLAGDSIIDLNHPPKNFSETIGIYLNRVSISFRVIYNNLKDSKNVPLSWRKEPLLRNLRPLIFEDGVVRFGNWVCEYSDELGIRFSKE